MQHHLWWHYCLFLLEQGEHDRIVELLHTKIRNPDSKLVQESPAATIDITNYASLLMRLELYGVDVSSLWQTFAEICADRTSNHGSVFSNVHDMMVLCGSGQQAKAKQLLDSMNEHFADPTTAGFIAQSYRQVGIPVCQAIAAHRAKDYAQVIRLLTGVRPDIHLMGGSYAQRDVFFHLLVDAAKREGQHDLAQQTIADIERFGFCDVPNRAAYKLT